MFRRTISITGKLKQEAQFILTNPRDAFRSLKVSKQGTLHMLGILYKCAVVIFFL